MKRFLVLAIVLTATVAVAQPADLFEYDNEIGIFLVENPTAESAQEDACYMGVPGQFTAYVVLTNPYNSHLDAPITTLGGFELKLVYPPGLLVSAMVHPAILVHTPPPEFQCSAYIPDVGSQCRLITLTIGTYTADPASWYLAPLDDPAAQSIPGAISVIDYDDNLSVSQAFPVSGDLEVPVFGMFDCADVVPNNEASWGGVKAMFR